MRSPGLAYEKDEALEGSALLVSHKRRERDPKLRAKKIAASASLDCEVCGLNFSQAYGERSEGYIEVHHTVPLHVSGMVKTTLDDRALLYSNYHRMIHRSPWLTPEEANIQRTHLADC